MRARLSPLVFVLALLPVPSIAQESDRTLKGSGQSGAFLTPGQVDRWFFDGEKGETIVVHVFSKEFDPLLGLARTAGKADETIVADVDDLGTESRFMIRLPAKGEYKIRVRAFKDQAGGNYKLSVRRFHAAPLVVGTPLVGTFDRNGQSHYYFKAVKDQILIPQLKGAANEVWSILDVKGRELSNWAGSVSIEESGECCLIVAGQEDYRFDLLVREANRLDVDVGKKAAAKKLHQGEMDVLSFNGKPGDFRAVEVEKTGGLVSQLIFSPTEKKSEARIARPGERPVIQYLPVVSRGGKIRYAAILGREGRYQLQLLATTDATYRLALSDPSIPMELGKEIEGNLPVGGAAFYRFTAAPGQLLSASLESQKFVPLLRLYDAQGKFVASSGSLDEQRGTITHMAVSEGTYRLQVSSLGDGGGGAFRQVLTEIKLKDLKIGGRGQGTIQPGATDFWAFSGKEGQTVFLNVRSATFEPVVSIRSPDGVRLVADNRGNAATGSLVALKLPRTGRYTVWIASSRGAGDYTVRLIDGD